jgi:adenylyltransferase/sulfurtransferase
MNLRSLELKRDPECPLCGADPTIRDLKTECYEFECEANAEDFGFGEEGDIGECPIELSVEEAKSLLASASTPRVYLLDVREPFEREICFIEGSVNIPFQQVATALEALPKGRRILVHCHHGARSMQIVKFLRSKGFDGVSNVGGGIHAWADRIDSTMNRY